MKQMKFVLMAAFAILMGTTVTSCLDSDDGPRVDGFISATTSEDIMGRVTLISDDGYTFVPNNPSLLKYSDGSLVERCVVYFAYNEGVVFDGDRSKKYGITIVQTGTVYPVRDYCNRVDTIEKDLPIREVTQMWGANGDYLTAEWKFNYTTTSETVGFEFYPYAVENDVLIMRLRQSDGSSGGYSTATTFTSFTMPSLDYINRTLGTELLAVNDSIQLKIATKTSESSEDLSTTKAIKVRIMQSKDEDFWD